MSFTLKRLCSRLYQSVCFLGRTHATQQTQRLRSAAERLSSSPAAARATCDNRVIVGGQILDCPLDSSIVGGLK